jgi:hypothetical protein
MNGIPASELRASIAHALLFIQEQQPASGLFTTLASSSPDLAGARAVESPYITTYIIHVLAQLAGDEVTSTMRSAGRALWSHREPGGLWRFFGHAAPNPPLDFDDTCCALVALRQCRLPTETKVSHFLGKAAAASGGYGTWLSTRLNVERELDVVVNANILLYLAGERPPVAELARFLMELVASRNFRGLSPFALSESPSIYALVRAYRHGPVPELAPLLPALVPPLLAAQRDDGSFGNELDTALSMTALLETGYPVAKLVPAARWMLDRQRPDGSWPRRSFFRDFLPTYYGSDELTTALCAEALHKLARC